MMRAIGGMPRVAVCVTMGSLPFRRENRVRLGWALLDGCVVLAAQLLAGCAHSEALSSEPASETAAEMREPAPRAEAQVGYATWYGAALAGHHTANGERFDPSKMTAAHRSLPFGTWVEVTRVDNGQSVRVRITDRGPFGHAERVIDLSREAARQLGTLKMGVVRVKLVVLPTAPAP